MQVMTYELRPGVDLVVEVSVKLRRDLTSPTVEMVENRNADETIARYTREYLDAHIHRAFDSLNLSRPA